MDCIVAPYEADAQLAYLNKCGIAQLIITEDSDLLLFGCDKVHVLPVKFIIIIYTIILFYNVQILNEICFLYF